MATYQFSALADDQAVVFNPNTDVLFFDEAFIRADLVRVTTEGANIRVRVESINKDVVLLNTTPLQLATSNVSFADPGRLLFGDNSPAQAADNAANVINGTGGSDLLAGFGGADTMNGGQGHDTYIVSSGDVLSDPGGIDTVESDVSWALGAGFENLKLTGTAAITANGNNLDNWLVGNDASNSSINGRGGDDVMWGMGGNDTFDMSTGGTSSYGNDQIDGGEGSDTVAFGGNARSGVAIRLEGEFGSMSGGGDGGAGSATLYSIENAAGGNFNDTIVGGNGANFLRGEGGSDILDGRAGNDRLQGGAGNDSFLFTVAPGTANADTLVDFASGADKIRLDAGVMTALGSAGNFIAGDARFWASSAGTAHDASDRAIYNTSTRQLFYDADGNGSGGAQLLFTLQPGATLAATDIAVDNGAPSGNVINGTAGNDSITGTFGDDSISGLGGNDTIDGNGGRDLLVGGDGDDHIRNGREESGNTAGDTLVGGNGNDVLDARGGGGFSATPTADSLDGGLGDDYFYVDQGDTVTDAGGVDTIEATDMDWTLGAGFENLRVNTDVGEAAANGTGNALDNEMWLMWGGGRLEGLAGNDTLHGGEKESTLVGGDGNDLLTGNWRSIMEGGAGNDTLVGGGVSTGGAGADDFDFIPLHDFSDSVAVTDFASGTDRIRLNGERLDGTGSSGTFSAGDQRFHAAAGATEAHDASDRVIYNTSTGDLYYDPDGTGSQLAFRLTTLQGAPSLAATDFYVINGTAAGGEHLVGTPGNDSLVGGAGDDTLDGLAGNDTLRGLDGNDVLDGGTGVDSMDGGTGDDTYYHDDFGDVLVDAGGVDTIIKVGGSNVRLGAGFENLILRIGSPGDLAGQGNELDNRIVNETSQGAWLNGYEGNDTIIGGSDGDFFEFYNVDVSYGDDVVDGGGGDRDWLFGPSESAVVIDGNAGLLTGGGVGGGGSIRFTGIDIFYLGQFDDLVHAGDAGGVHYMGGSGADTLFGGTGADELSGAGSFDFPPFDDSNDEIHGGGGNDTIDGGAGNDLLFGDEGNDSFYFRGDDDAYGDDTVDGGGGSDTIRIAVAGNLSVDLAAGTMTGGTPDGSGRASLTAIESVSIWAGSGQHRLLGSATANLLEILPEAGPGMDTLDGGAGNDTLIGGAGADQYLFRVAPGTANADLIGGFASTSDKVVLDGNAFASTGASGNFAAGDARFWSSTTGNVHDADDRVTYNTSTGELWYDADGTGAGARQLIATLQGTPTLAATDIAIVNGSGGGGGGVNLVGTSGNDSLTGTAGNDTINGLGGADTMNGLAGDDTYFVTAGDVIQDSGGVDTIFAAASFALPSSIENITYTGSAGTSSVGNYLGNVMTGNSNANYMEGRGANDTLIGNAGNDTLHGGVGLDTLTGGEGLDSFRFAAAPGSANADVVTDFVSGTDRLQFDDAFHAGIGALGNFAAGDGRFWAAAGATSAHDANDRVVYNTTNGNLYYDADGSGAGAAQLVATLQGQPALGATDIFVI